jgi:hypothetical protein
MAFSFVMRASVEQSPIYMALGHVRTAIIRPVMVAWRVALSRTTMFDPVSASFYT